MDVQREKADCVVIGAGVVGLAIARRLSLAGREVIILESGAEIGAHTSSRNSEVIHAGIYYPTDSLKARFCVAGRDMLYRYCAERGVDHRRCGKLIAATSEAEEPQLSRIAAAAAANGVDDLKRLSTADLQAMEPALEDHGAMIAFNALVESGEVGEGGILLRVGGAMPMALDCGVVINSAGLGAPAVAGRLAGLPAGFAPRQWLAKGNYFTLGPLPPFKRLIYPVPEPGGLGVHLTLDLAGRARFGPDVEWIDAIDYEVDPARSEHFYAAIRKYWPDLPDDALQPGYAGIRPKLDPKGAPPQDFVIQGPADHGVAGLVNLFGIESPGLTASMAIAEHVSNLL
jgi:L-2-hydroxyglutarate oxidase LhgO